MHLAAEDGAGYVVANDVDGLVLETDLKKKLFMSWASSACLRAVMSMWVPTARSG